jgi:hypothetical protein
MEPTGHYFENLARHLHHDHRSPRPVTLINSFAVSINRDQQMMHREKDDEIDVAAIGDLLRRGEGTPFQPINGLYLEMQHLARVRLSKVKIRTALKNQIVGHLDRIFPGLVIQGKVAYAPAQLYEAMGFKPFDAYPFIFLNLMLSMLAAVQAPVILMSQNRQAMKDRITARHDYEVNLRTQLEILRLSRRIEVLAEDVRKIARKDAASTDGA